MGQISQVYLHIFYHKLLVFFTIIYHKIRIPYTRKCIEINQRSSSIHGNFMYVQSFLTGGWLYNPQFLDAGAEGIGIHLQD